LKANRLRNDQAKLKDSALSESHPNDLGNEINILNAENIRIDSQKIDDIENSGQNADKAKDAGKDDVKE